MTHDITTNDTIAKDTIAKGTISTGYNHHKIQSPMDTITTL